MYIIYMIKSLHSNQIYLIFVAQTKQVDFFIVKV